MGECKNPHLFRRIQIVNDERKTAEQQTPTAAFPNGIPFRRFAYRFDCLAYNRLELQTEPGPTLFIEVNRLREFQLGRFVNYDRLH